MTGMTCEAAFEALVDRLHHASTPEDVAALEAHLRLCAPCRRHAAFEERFQRLLRSVAEGERCPADVRERLLAALRRAAQG